MLGFQKSYSEAKGTNWRGFVLHKRDVQCWGLRNGMFLPSHLLEFIIDWHFSYPVWKPRRTRYCGPGAHGVFRNKHIKVRSRTFKRQHNTGCLDIADCPWPLLLKQGYICISFLQSAHIELPHSEHQMLCWATEVQSSMWVAVSLPGWCLMLEELLSTQEKTWI